MKALVLVNTALAGMLMGGAAWAANDCADPVADWQPRERLRQQIEQRGGTVQRIKVDDGCYEVRGIDARGNRFKGKDSPQSLRIKKLEIDLFFSKLRTYMRSSKSRARQTNNKISHKLRLNLFLNSIITIFYKIKLDII